MTELSDNTKELQLLIDRTQRGEDAAFDELIERTHQRLEQLARAMLKNDSRVKRWEQTDDVLQASLIRLHRSFAEVRPKSTRHFFRLANTQIRRTLIGLVRHSYGSRGGRRLWLSVCHLR